MKTLGCFVYLVNHRDPKHINMCKESLRLLNVNYLSKFGTPVIMFHERDMPGGLRQALQGASAAPLTFECIPFDAPAHVDTTKIAEGCRLGYMNMCRFYANEIFKQPILNDFKYYCRLDTDSYIRSPVEVDLFEDVHSSDIVYGFINDSIRDNPKFTVGLWNLADSFIASHPEIPTYAKLFTDIPERGLYYTNFEVCHIPWFKGKTWQMFFDAVDRDGGIYRHRWGDHTLRYIGVRSFVPADKIKRITYIHYSHQGIVDNVPGATINGRK